MKVYIVFWADSFDDWRLVKAFSTMQKAEEYLTDKSDSFWVVEEVLE